MRRGADRGTRSRGATRGEPRRATAVVTGASSGIGRAVAVALASRCETLALVARDERRLRATAATVERHDARASTWVADLGSDAEATAVAEGLRSAFPRLDVLVHAAGAYAMGTVADVPIEAFDEQLDVNLRAPYVLTRALLPALVRARGEIVFVNSTAGLSARAGVAQYAATKHALKAMADSLREEVNPAQVRVLTVYPGRTATRMQELVHALEGRVYRPERLLRPDDVAAVILNALSLPRTAEVTDITIRPFAKPQ